ncbi:MAG: fibronectin type III domain-containing protein, partial [Planctomycetaceae bacterium]|nr:fibronectin type III domain-containing protein [Planctomycetaceae bacterium]
MNIDSFFRNNDRKTSALKAKKRRQGRSLRLEELENREMLDGALGSIFAGAAFMPETDDQVVVAPPTFENGPQPGAAALSITPIGRGADVDVSLQALRTETGNNALTLNDIHGWRVSVSTPGGITTYMTLNTGATGTGTVNTTIEGDVISIRVNGLNGGGQVYTLALQERTNPLNQSPGQFAPVFELGTVTPIGQIIPPSTERGQTSTVEISVANLSTLHGSALTEANVIADWHVTVEQENGGTYTALAPVKITAAHISGGVIRVDITSAAAWNGGQYRFGLSTTPPTAGAVTQSPDTAPNPPMVNLGMQYAMNVAAPTNVTATLDESTGIVSVRWQDSQINGAYQDDTSYKIWISATDPAQSPFGLQFGFDHCNPWGYANGSGSWVPGGSVSARDSDGYRTFTFNYSDMTWAGNLPNGLALGEMYWVAISGNFGGAGGETILSIGAQLDLTNAKVFSDNESVRVVENVNRTVGDRQGTVEFLLADLNSHLGTSYTAQQVVDAGWSVRATNPDTRMSDGNAVLTMDGFNATTGLFTVTVTGLTNNREETYSFTLTDNAEANPTSLYIGSGRVAVAEAENLRAEFDEATNSISVNWDLEGSATRARLWMWAGGGDDGEIPPSMPYPGWAGGTSEAEQRQMYGWFGANATSAEITDHFGTLTPGVYWISIQTQDNESDYTGFDNRNHYESIVLQNPVRVEVTALPTFDADVEFNTETSGSVGREIELNWNAVAGATHYQVQYGGNTYRVEGTSTVVNIWFADAERPAAAVANKTNVTFEVRAIEMDGDNIIRASNWDSITIPATASPQPTITSIVSNSDGSVTVNWEPVTWLSEGTDGKRFRVSIGIAAPGATTPGLEPWVNNDNIRGSGDLSILVDGQARTSHTFAADQVSQLTGTDTIPALEPGGTIWAAIDTRDTTFVQDGENANNFESMWANTRFSAIYAGPETDMPQSFRGELAGYVVLSAGGGVNLTWGAASKDGVQVQRYEVRYVKTDDAGNASAWVTLPAGAVTGSAADGFAASITGLDVNTNYTFEAIAVFSDDTRSSTPAVISVQVPFPQVQNVRAQFGADGQIIVNWDTMDIANGYRIFIGRGATAPGIQGPDGTDNWWGGGDGNTQCVLNWAHTSTGGYAEITRWGHTSWAADDGRWQDFDPNETYWISIQASPTTGDGGKGVQSIPVQVAEYQPYFAESVTITATSAGSVEIEFTLEELNKWLDTPATAASLVGWRITYGTSGSYTIQASDIQAGNVTAAISGLAGSTSYSFMLTNGAGVNLMLGSATTHNIAVPTGVTAALAGDGSIVVTWPDVLGANSYRVYISADATQPAIPETGDSPEWWGGPTGWNVVNWNDGSTTVVIPATGGLGNFPQNIDPNGTYWISIMASPQSSDANRSNMSIPVAVEMIPIQQVSAPTNVRAAQSSSNQVTVSWQIPVVPDGMSVADIKEYIVTLTPAGGGQTITHTETNSVGWNTNLRIPEWTSSATITLPANVAANAQYAVTVVAVTEKAGYSNSQAGTGEVDVRPVTPAPATGTFQARADNNARTTSSVTLELNRHASRAVTNVLYYEITSTSHPALGTIVVPANATGGMQTVKIEGLNANTSYRFNIVVYGDNGAALNAKGTNVTAKTATAPTNTPLRNLQNDLRHIRTASGINSVTLTGLVDGRTYKVEVWQTGGRAANHAQATADMKARGEVRGYFMTIEFT